MSPLSPAAELGRYREVTAVGRVRDLAVARIALIAPDPLSRAGIEGLLGRYPDLRLVPPSRSADAHLLVLVAARPGPEFTARLRAAAGFRPRPGVPVLAVLDGPGEAGGAELAALGVVACLWRSELTPEHLAGKIRALTTTPRRTRPADDPGGDLAADLDRYRREAGRVPGPSSREADVLRLLADGLGVTEIAQQLACSERTVQKTLYLVTTRLDLRNRAHAVAYAWREGVL